jgi:hypothetical protein
MKNNLVYFAAVKAFYESDNDFIGAFSFFVLQVIKEEKMSIDDVKDEVLKEFGINIPCDLIPTLLRRLKKNNYVDYQEFNTVLISEDGRKKIVEIKEEIANSKRETGALLNDMGEYLKKKDKIFSIDKIEKELELFLEHNLQSAALILQGNGNNKTGHLTSNLELSHYIIEYFIEVEKSDPENFQRLRSLVYGTIITSILKRDTFTISSFQGLNVYLDTNIIFSLLNLHDEAFNKPTRELFELLKKNRCKTWVFSFTMDEVKNVLSGYLKSYDSYPVNININSIYSRLKKKNYSKHDVILLMHNLEEELSKLEVSIDYGYNLDELDISTEEIEELNKLKGDEKNTLSLKHDIGACKIIKKIRKIPRILIEKSEAIFLTADKTLFNYNFDKGGHKESSPLTIPEIIMRDFLASILWLKNPDFNSKLPINTIIAGYKQNLLISSSIWLMFVGELKKMRDGGNISDDDINILISSNEVEGLLLNVQHGKSRAEDIPVFISSEIEKRKKDNEQKMKKIDSQEGLINEQRKQINDLRNIVNTQKEVEESKIIDENERKNKRNSLIEKKCKNSVKTKINIFIVIVFLIVSVILFFCTKLAWDKESTVPGIRIWVISLVIVLIFALCLILISLLMKKNFIPKDVSDKIPFDLIEFRENFENKMILNLIIREKEKNYIID